MRYLPFIFFLLVTSCAKFTFKDLEINDCGCITQEPKLARVTVYFTRSEQQRSPSIILMSGFYEENNSLDTIYTDTVPAYQNYFTLYLPVEHYYTFCAVYLRNNDTIYAVDGDLLHKTKYYDSDCDTTCWRLSGTTFNVKLKTK